MWSVVANGPAVSGSFWCRVDWRLTAGVQVFVTVFIRPKGARHGAIFARHGDVVAFYECRGTNIIGAINLSRCRNRVEATRCSVAVQTWVDEVICHGAEFFKRADERIMAYIY